MLSHGDSMGQTIGVAYEVTPLNQSIILSGLLCLVGLRAAAGRGWGLATIFPRAWTSIAGGLELNNLYFDVR
jgi:hypothetical protein